MELRKEYMTGNALPIYNITATRTLMIQPVAWDLCGVASDMAAVDGKGEG